jgi:hypothetical protein
MPAMPAIWTSVALAQTAGDEAQPSQLAFTAHEPPAGVVLIYPASVALVLLAVIALNPVYLIEEANGVLQIAAGARRVLVRRAALLLAGVMDVIGPRIIRPVERLLALRRPATVALSPYRHVGWLRRALRWVLAPVVLGQGARMIGRGIAEHGGGMNDGRQPSRSLHQWRPAVFR